MGFDHVLVDDDDDDVLSTIPAFDRQSDCY